MKLSAKGEGPNSQMGIIPGRLVKVTGEMVHVIVPQEGTHGAPHPTEEPQVALIREGDVIQGIEVTCTCGSKIRLRCIY